MGNCLRVCAMEAWIRVNAIAEIRKNTQVFIDVRNTMRRLDGRVLGCTLGSLILCILFLLVLNTAAVLFDAGPLPNLISNWWTLTQFPKYPNSISKGTTYDVENTSPEQIVRFYETQLSEPQWTLLYEKWYEPNISDPFYPNKHEYYALIDYHPFGPILQKHILMRVFGTTEIDTKSGDKILSPDTIITIDLDFNR